MAYCAYCGSHVGQVSFAPCASCGKPTNGAPPPPARSSSPAAIIIGVIVGLLVVVMIIGILAAIAIPNLLTAMERSKQKRTMADMRSLAVAMETYRVDKNVFPSDINALAPTYIRSVPRKDGWSHDLAVEVTAQGYVIASAGKDGRFDRNLQDYTTATTENFDCDIVFANGNFVQYPQGIGGGR